MHELTKLHKMDSFIINSENYDEIVSNYNSYGCWCFLEHLSFRGGKPISDIDYLCKNLTDSYRSIISEVKGCNPFHTSYNNKGYFYNSVHESMGSDSFGDYYDSRNVSDASRMNGWASQGFDDFVGVKSEGSVEGNIKVDSAVCEDNNIGSECRIETCKAEMKFVEELHEFIFYVEEDDRDVFSHGAGFDPSLECYSGLKNVRSK